MNLSRLTWQLPLLLLATTPLWQGSLARFLTIRQGLPEAPLEQDSSFHIQGLVFSQSEHGEASVVVSARQLSGSDDGRVYTLEQAEAKRLGANPAQIRGGFATYDSQTEILTVTDQVTVTTPELKITTDALRYLAKYDTVKSAADVVMEGQGLTLSGTSFRYQLPTGSLRVGARVKCLYTPTPPAT